jgi:hypothetical protein
MGGHYGALGFAAWMDGALVPHSGLEQLGYNAEMCKSLQEQDLFEKIWALPEEKVAEVAGFVAFLQHRRDDRRFVQTSAGLFEDALRKVWDNADDADYDRL